MDHRARTETICPAALVHNQPESSARFGDKAVDGSVPFTAGASMREIDPEIFVAVHDEQRATSKSPARRSHCGLDLPTANNHQVALAMVDIKSPIPCKGTYYFKHRSKHVRALSKEYNVVSIQKQRYKAAVHQGRGPEASISNTLSLAFREISLVYNVVLLVF
jgi:hypothetical protein